MILSQYPHISTRKRKKSDLTPSHTISPPKTAGFANRFPWLSPPPRRHAPYDLRQTQGFRNGPWTLDVEGGAIVAAEEAELQGLQLGQRSHELREGDVPAASWKDGKDG